MKLKSFPSVTRTWQPVTWFAYATQAPERPRRLMGVRPRQCQQRALNPQALADQGLRGERAEDNAV